MTATTANATLTQSITLASTPVVSSFWLKRSVGTGQVLISQDGFATTTDVTAQFNSAGFLQVKTALQTLANPQIGIKIVTSGDAVIVDFAQTESSSATMNG